MKHSLLFYKNFKTIILLILITSFSNAQNLLTNGDFEAATQVGNGFDVDGTFTLVTIPTGSTVQGNYAFTNNPQPFNSVFINTGDHTTGAGKMMIVDGSANSSAKFWKAGNAVTGLCGLTPGLTYKFSYWIKTISTNSTTTFSRANIIASFTNTVGNTGTLSPGSLQLVPVYNAIVNNWVRVEYSFVPTNTCVNIELSNSRTGANGNDFAIDDLQVSAPLSISSSFVNASCTTLNDGSISIYGNGGLLPYTYNLTGQATLTNTVDGVFRNLVPGIYNLSVTDGANTTVSGGSITITEPKLIVNNPSTINLLCPNQIVNLTVSGGTTYTWSSNPNDLTLTTPNIFNPVVTPTANTIYTVTSTTPTVRELVTNGNFSLGNVGFTSDYNYINPANTGGLQKRYGIVTNPNTWFSTFLNCTDNPTGIGNMMVVDGSNTNAGNDKLWCQKIPVATNTNYTFSYYIQNVVAGSLATLETKINGISQGAPVAAPAAITCPNWILVSYNWNSGLSNLADICIYDTNTSVAGNDFSIDDISFTTVAPTVCNLTNTVRVNIGTTGVTLTNVPTNFTVCSGVRNVATAFGSNTVGVNYSWTNSNPAIGIVASGTGNLTDFVLTNTTAAPITATISVTANEPVSTCSSPTQTYIITVKPIILVQQADVFICNAISQPSIGFSSLTPLTANEEFYWTNDELLIGLPTDGVGAIPAFVSIINSTSENLNATITVYKRNKTTQALSDCGMTFRIILKPAIVVVCNNPVRLLGNPNTIISASVNVIEPPGTYIYTWTIPAGFANPGNVATFPFPPVSFTGVLAAGIYDFSVVVRNTVTGCESNIEFAKYNYGQINPLSQVGVITNNNAAGLNLCGNDSCVTLDASVIDLFSTSDYNVQSVPYEFVEVLGQVGTPLSPSDDSFTVGQVLDFKFCFYGLEYDKYQIGTNTFLKFYTGAPNSTAAGSSGWAFTQTVPSTSLDIRWRNSIYWPMQDTDPTPGVSPEVTITNYSNAGKEIFTMLKMGNFACDLNNGPQESQLVLTQNTNVIDVNIKSRTACVGHNSGSGVVGLHNATGLEGRTPLTRNTGPWNAAEESWRFTPSGPNITNFEWLEAGVVISTERVFKVCPTITTTFTARVTYNNCGQPLIFTQDFIVKVNSDLTNEPLNINNIPTTNTYNISANRAVILGSLPVSSTTISFYPSLSQAIALAGQIINLNAYSGVSGQEIIAVIRNNASSCITYKSFKLFNTDPSNSGPICAGLTFDLNTPDIGVGGTYSWTSPNGFSSALSNPTNIDSNIYGAGIYTIETYLNGVLQSTRSTTLIINPLPTITSFTPLKSSVCSGTSTSLQVVGTPDSVIDFNDGTGVVQLTIPPIGTLLIPTGNLTVATTYTILKIRNATTTCETIFAPARNLIITIDPPVNAGVDGTRIVCGNDLIPINLNNVITGQQLGGTWQDVSVLPLGGTFVAATGTFTPDSNPNFNTTRKFSYTLPANGDCPANSSVATVTFNSVPNANLTVDKTTVCQDFDSPILTFSGSNGTPPYTFSYTLGGASQPNIVTTTGNSVTLPVPTGALATLIYCLKGVQDANCPNVLAVPICRTINVLDAPAATEPSAPYEVCDDNITFDGIGQFNLHSKDSEISTVPGIQITYYPTRINAENASSNDEISEVGNPLYTNVTNPQTIYARVFDAATPACYTIVELVLRVNPRPILNASLKPFEICDVTGPALNDGFETFTLSDKDADIIGTQTGVVVRYYLNQPLAIANLLGNALPNSYPNTTAFSQTIYYTITNTTSGCSTTDSLELKVNPIPVAPALSVGFPAFEKCNTNTATPGFEVFDLTSKIPMLLNGQNGVSVTFYLSQPQAISGLPVNAIPNPTAYTNATLAPQTIWVRLTNNLTKCYAISTMNLIVFPLPIPNPIIPDEDLTICDGDSDGKSIFNLSKLIPLIINNPAPIQPLTVTFYNTPENAQGGLVGDQLPLLFPNTNPFSQTIYARLQNSVTGCFAIKLITLKIDPAPKLPLNPALKDITECDEDLINDQDGKTEINLTQQNAFFFAAGLNAPTSNFEISYYNTSVDANTAPAGINQIINPSSYIGTDAEIIWVRIENKTTKCFEVTSFKLIINKPLVIVPLNLLSLCDTSPTNTTPRTTPFNLVLNRNAAVLANATPPANYTVSYYTNATIPRAYTGLITNPTAYVNTSSPQTLGVIVTNITTGCKSYSTLTIEVLTIPTSGLTTNPALGTNPNLAPVITKCDDDNVLPLLTEVFDLTTNSAAIINNNATLTLHYYPTKVDAELGTNEIVLPTLDPENYRTKTGSVWIQLRSTTLNSQGVYCFDLIEQPLKVNPLPILDLLDAQTHPGNLFRKCEIVILPPGAPVISKFDLTSLKTELNISNNALPVTTPIATTFPIIFYTNPNDAVAGNNPITNDTAYESTVAIGVRQRIYYSIKNSLTGCFNYGSFEIIVDNKPIITLPPVVAVCDDNDGTNDGLVAYPLDDALKIAILGNQTLQPLTGFTVTFYINKIDADAGTNNFTDLLGHQAQTGSLWIRVENNLTTCYNIAESVQTVEIIPEPTIETLDNNNTICVNYLTGDLERGLILRAKNNKPRTGVTNTYKWFLEDVAGIFNLVGTNATYEITTSASDPEKPRRFKLEMSNVNTNPLLTCPVTSTIFDVYQSGPAVAKAGTIGYFVTNAFESNQTITVTVDGYGTYQYSLDEGDKQDSPVFESVSLEDHKITVWDVEGNGNPCKEFTIDNVSTIDYPHYFTPNGDGINDTWNIVGLKKQTDAKIYIFDREGKLVKQVSPDGQGWDGTRNENLMPSTDYWFTVDYTEQKLSKQFKSHFSLKR